MNGKIIFFRYKLNPISILIRFFINFRHKEKCPYNHVGMLVEINKNLCVLESNEKGVHVTEFKKRIHKQDFQIREYKYNKAGVKKHSKAFIGLKYDYWAVLWHYLLFYITGNWYGHSQAFAEKSFYCSELVARIINLSDPTKLKDWHKTDPRDLYINSKEWN